MTPESPSEQFFAKHQRSHKDDTASGLLERQCEHILSFVEACIEIHAPNSGAQKALEDVADGIRAGFMAAAIKADKTLADRAAQSAVLDADARDAARWRRQCSLMIRGLLHIDRGDANTVLELTQLLDADLAATPPATVKEPER